MIGRLPSSLAVDGEEYAIRTDFRDILTIMAAFNDPELTDGEKFVVMIVVLFEDSDIILGGCNSSEAIQNALWFLDCGQTVEDKKPPAKVMDWEQDEPILFPAINKVAGKEVRATEYMHWWTFMGYFMEIEDGTFSTVLGIRQRRAKGRKLEKWELEFYRDNKAMCDLKSQYTVEEQEERDYWDKRLG